MRVTFLLVVIAAAIFASLVRPEKAPPTSGGEAVPQASNAQEPEFASASVESGGPQAAGIELRRQADGHFYADVEVNGAVLHMLVDTGASEIALSREDARSARLATSIGMREVIGRGADGDVHGEAATLDHVSLGQKTVEGLPAVVLDSGEQSLLGQSFLSKFDHVEIEGDTMVLR